MTPVERPHARRQHPGPESFRDRQAHLPAQAMLLPLHLLHGCQRGTFGPFGMAQQRQPAGGQGALAPAHFEQVGPQRLF